MSNLKINKMMTTMTVKEVREEQVTDLTVKNAYRVSLI